MAKKRDIGFNRGEVNEAEKEKTLDVKIKDIDKEFSRVISELGMEEELYLTELTIEKVIRKELTKLHKRIKKIEKKISKRNNLVNQCRAQASDIPENSLELITKIQGLDEEISPEADTLFKDIAKHSIPDIDELYKNIDLSEKQIKHIRVLVNNLSIRLSNMMRPVNEAIQGQQLESMRREILMKNPHLK
jgi:hypothetical protein